MRTDFVRKHAAHAAKIRRSKRQSKKNFVVYYNRENEPEIIEEHPRLW